MSAKVVAITGGAQGIGRAIGVPDDIAKACLFLAESAAFMTGQEHHNRWRHDREDDLCVSMKRSK